MSAHRRKTLQIISISLGILAAFVIGGLMFLRLRSHENVAQSDGPERNQRIASKFASPSEDEARALVNRALATHDPLKMEECIRLGGASPQEVSDFLRNSVEQDGRIQDINWLGSMDADDFLLETVLITYENKGKITERLALLVVDEKGVWRMDFDAFARSCRPGWADLISGKAERSEVRVFATRDTYYNGVFHDENEWVCYAITSPELKAQSAQNPNSENQDLLRAYCKKGSPQAAAMERVITAENRMSRLTLILQRKTGADARQFEIARVLSRDWAVPPIPFDEKFQ